MKIRWTGLALNAALLMMVSAAGADQASGAENGLIGIKLYDPGLRVISIYGTPDLIEAVNIGSGGAASGGAFGNGGSPFAPGGPAGGGGRGGGGKRGGGGPTGGATAADSETPFDFGDSVLRDTVDARQRPGGFGPGGAPAGFGGPGGPGGMGGPRGGGAAGAPVGPGSIPGAGGPGAAGGSGIPRGNGGAAESTSYTRWIYNRSGSKYAFVIDKAGRVVQIEAVGIQNAKVKTKRGLGFGATFAQIIKLYQVPDGYEISGDNVMVKFLSKDKVAFRLTRLGEKTPQVVTGIVVAAAKG